jgi:very-short-patch-repair endonuclease
MGWKDLMARAEAQYGVFARWQTRELGVPRWRVTQQIERGALEAVTPIVVRVRGTPTHAHQDAMIAVLDAGSGAVLSHHSAAALWELPGFDLGDLHVTRLRSGTRRGEHLADVHQPCRLLSSHVTVLDHIPVTSPTRTLFDLAGLIHPKRTERTLETAWSKHLTNGRFLARMLKELAVRGRPGIQIMRELLSKRGPEYIPPASGLEGRFRDILQRDEQRTMDRQVDVGGEKWLGRIDFIDREARLIVQIDSERYHEALIDKAADEAQSVALREAGFEVLRVTDTQVWFRPNEVTAAVRRARSRKPAR